MGIKWRTLILEKNQGAIQWLFNDLYFVTLTIRGISLKKTPNDCLHLKY